MDFNIWFLFNVFSLFSLLLLIDATAGIVASKHDNKLLFDISFVTFSILVITSLVSFLVLVK